MLWAGEAQAGTFPSFNSTPRTVNSFQDDLTTTFRERTALLLANTTGVVGGTGMFSEITNSVYGSDLLPSLLQTRKGLCNAGSAKGRLVPINCFKPASECFPAEGESPA